MEILVLPLSNVVWFIVMFFFFFLMSINILLLLYGSFFNFLLSVRTGMDLFSWALLSFYSLTLLRSLPPLS